MQTEPLNSKGSGGVDAKLMELLAQREEVVTRLPDWMLSGAAMNALKHEGRPLIVEIAGRDSVAAAILACREVEATAVLPTVAYTGTEYGPLSRLLRAREILANRLEPAVTVYPTVFLGAPRFWWALSGRFMSLFVKRLGAFSPCLGCHLYLHALRIPLARELTCPVVAGERELHDDAVKINQSGPALDSYLRLYERFSATLLLPLRFVASGDEVTRLLDEPWEGGSDQLECVLSSNYCLPDATLGLDLEEVRSYFDRFGLPVAEMVVRGYISGEHVDPAQVAAAVAEKL